MRHSERDSTDPSSDSSQKEHALPKDKPRSAKEERREQEIMLRRNDILAAASRAFADKGFQGTQVAEIAHAAEVSLNSVYAQFKGKEELYEAVISSAAKTVGDRVSNAVRDITDPAEQLLCVIDVLFDCFEEHRDLMRIYANSTHGLPWRVRQSMGEDSLEVFQAFTVWLIDRAHEAKKLGYLLNVDAETFALSLIGTVTTTAARWIEDPAHESLSSFAPRVRTLFAQLLGASRP